SFLESTLYNNRQDLLFTYFGVNIRGRGQHREALIKRRVQLKKQMRRDFLASYDEMVTRGRDGSVTTFNCSNVVIRDVEDDSYPTIVRVKGKISPWFKTEPFDFYHNGIEVCLGIAEAIFDEKDRWDILDGRADPRGDS